MARSTLDILTLDERIEEEISKHGTLKDFHIVVWRHEPDETGCNWSGRIERVRGSRSLDVSWWDVLPKLREHYNLE